MSVSREAGLLIIDAGDTRSAFGRLQAGALEAVATRSERTLVDVREVDPLDGAMLAVLARMSVDLGPERRVAVLASEDTLQFMIEWRLDALWLSYSDRGAAIEGLSR